MLIESVCYFQCVCGVDIRMESATLAGIWNLDYKKYIESPRHNTMRNPLFSMEYCVIVQCIQYTPKIPTAFPTKVM